MPDPGYDMVTAAAPYGSMAWEEAERVECLERDLEIETWAAEFGRDPARHWPEDTEFSGGNR